MCGVRWTLGLRAALPSPPTEISCLRPERLACRRLCPRGKLHAPAQRALCRAHLRADRDGVSQAPYPPPTNTSKKSVIPVNSKPRSAIARVLLVTTPKRTPCSKQSPRACSTPGKARTEASWAASTYSRQMATERSHSCSSVNHWLMGSRRGMLRCSETSSSDTAPRPICWSVCTYPCKMRGMVSIKVPSKSQSRTGKREEDFLEAMDENCVEMPERQGGKRTL
jgi:hypothetical protein